MMMMIGDHPRSDPTVQILPWDHHYAEDPMAHIQYEKAMAALQRYLPSNRDDVVPEDDIDVPVDAFSCDDFRMFEFKVKRCAIARSHDWTECPFAHPGEKARRRDPRRYHYSGGACPDFRRGECRRGDACEYAHGVFEAWLHPARYRTQPCKEGTHCRRRVCFFAHTPEQLRVLPYSGNPESPSPPLSPGVSNGLSSVNQLAESMLCLQLNKMKMGLGRGLSLSSSGSPPSWAGLGIGSPRSPSTIRPGFMSLPSTPILRPGISPFDAWGASCEEEPVMERVESGKELREKIYAKIGMENSLDRDDQVCNTGSDLEWVVDLVD